MASLHACWTQLVSLRPFLSRSTVSTQTHHCSTYSRRYACSALDLQIQQVAASARLNSMNGPLPTHSEDVGQPIDTVLEPGLQLMHQHLKLESRQLTLVVPQDVDAVLDMYIDRDQGDRDPYWCRLWPSAVALAQLILQQPDLVKGKKVCDIGSGLGLAGIAAALSGAREVVMLDREAIALQCSLLSAQACGLSSVEDYRLHPSPLAASQQPNQQPLLQGQSQQQEQQPSRQKSSGSNGHGAGSSDATTRISDQSSAQPQVRAELFDWTSHVCHGHYDVALACDVLYEHFSVEPVANIAPQLLNPKAGKLLLADPSRRTRDNREKFLQLLSSQPKAPMLLQESLEVTIRMDDLDTQIQLQQLQMRQGQETVGLKIQWEG